LWYGGAEVVRGRILLGDLVLFLSYAGMIFMPVQELARVLSDLQSAQAAAERVVDLLKTEPQIKDSPEVVDAVRRNTAARDAARPAEAAEPGLTEPGRVGPVGFDEGTAHLANSKEGTVSASVSGNGDGSAGRNARVTAPDGLSDRIDAVEFRAVSFAYKPGHSVLEGFSLRIEAGQTIALAGPTGGGKTTVASLLCRFYEPTAGQILLDDIDYRRRPLAWLQSKLGVVLQAPHLFSGSVRDNIRYGRLSAADAEVEAAAAAAGAHEFILKLEKGYDTDVGQRGNKLSVGQKQLISLARAVLADPRIFILDEATSSVDAEVERAIQAGIERVLRGRISLVIAHRLSTIRSADRILVIDRGRIVEDGTHRRLIARRGRYHELYVSQFARQREDALLGAAGTSVDGNGK
jgi:ATP-binding cassette subfamily B protein